jgi:hypothetical protein
MLDLNTQHLDLTERVSQLTLQLVPFLLHPIIVRDETFQRTDAVDG